MANLCYRCYLTKTKLYERTEEVLSTLWNLIPCNGTDDPTSRRKCDVCDLLGRFVRKVTPILLDEAQAKTTHRRKVKKTELIKEIDKDTEEDEVIETEEIEVSL